MSRSCQGWELWRGSRVRGAKGEEGKRGLGEERERERHFGECDERNGRKRERKKT